MRIDLTAQQYTWYQNHHEVRFGDFLSDAEVALIRSCLTKRDNFRSHPLIKRLLCRKDIGFIIHELTKSSQVRLLEDEGVLPGAVEIGNRSFQGILMGVLFELETKEAVFFSPEKELHVETSAYLAVYGQGNALFIHNVKNPHGNELKKMGYAYGDRLKPSDFPFVYH